MNIKKKLKIQNLFIENNFKQQKSKFFKKQLNIIYLIIIIKIPKHLRNCEIIKLIYIKP